MVVYIIILFILFSLLTFEFVINKREKFNKVNVTTYFGIFILTLFACLRGISVGADTINYAKYFEDSSMLEGINNLFTYAEINFIENGYIIYNKILSLFFSGDQAITFANSIILMTFLYIFIKNNSINKTFSLYIFLALGFYQTSLNMIPSNIAALICLSYTYMIEEKKNIKYFLVVFIAMQFHRSAFVFIILPFISKIILNKKRVFNIYLLGALFLISYTYIFPILEKIVPSVYKRYLYTKDIGNGIVFILQSIIVLFICTIYNWKEHNEKNNILLWSVMIGLTFYWPSFKLEIFSRVAFLFTPALIAIMPNMMSTLKVKNYKRTILFSIYIILGLIFIARISINNIGKTMPYMFYWQ